MGLHEFFEGIDGSIMIQAEKKLDNLNRDHEMKMNQVHENASANED